MRLENEGVVMILDAGGTNFVFSAVQNKRIINNLSVKRKAPTKGSTDEAIQAIIQEFENLKIGIENLGLTAIAISIAMPGPADFKSGIIGKLENLPSFSQGGVALQAYLEDRFEMPVFINNDGDMFAYGEAWQDNGILNRCGLFTDDVNLVGLTLGTGFGAGVVVNGKLLMGNNCAAGEINRMRNYLYPEYSVEYSVSIAGLQRVYGDYSLTPEDIYNVAIGKTEGDIKAATKAFDEFALVAADAIANAITMFDCTIVIGGGIANAYPLFLDNLVSHLNTTFNKPNGFEKYERLEVRSYNVEDEEELMEFLTPDMETVIINGRKISYNKTKKIGIGVSKVLDENNKPYQDTSLVIAIGAYMFAVHKIKRICTNI